MSKLVLGKGLEALIPGDRKLPNSEQSRYHTVPLESIQPNPMQPRREFAEESLKELAVSLKRDGLMQPLVVRKDGSSYTIIAGERRFRAASIAGLKQVPVVVLENVDDTRMLELALIENLQREDLNPLEVADAYRVLIDRCGLTQNELALRVGKSRSAVANLVRLLQLPESIKAMVRDGRLTEGHARAILAASSEEEMLRLAQQVIETKMTVRGAEQASSGHKRGRPATRRKSPELMEAEAFLKRQLGTSVRVHHGPKRGRIEIEYYGDDDLSRLLELFGQIGSQAGMQTGP
jgi:ParB family chromosome partitioning protein